MKRSITSLLMLLVFVALAPNKTHAQVTSNVLERVLNVRVNAGTAHVGTATAFTLDVDGREYLITAKHVVQGLRNEDIIDILMDDKWSPLKVQIFRCEDPIDIAVLIPPHQLTVNFALPFDTAGFFFGQDAYFMGFPFGLQSPGQGANGPYPLPIIKRGTISGNRILDAQKKARQILLDGYNNPGFSGGPIVYRDLSQSGVVMKIAGVVSGFRPEIVPVMKERDIKSRADASDAAKQQPWKIQQRTDGSWFEYVENGSFVSLNTGIVLGFYIDPAIDLIREHPIGPEAKELPGNQPR